MKEMRDFLLEFALAGTRIDLRSLPLTKGLRRTEGCRSRKDVIAIRFTDKIWGG